MTHPSVRAIRRLAICATALITAVSCQQSFDERLSEEAKDYTEKHCPSMIEPGQWLDSVTYDPSTRTLHQWHTFAGPLDTDEARQAIQGNPEVLQNSVREHLRSDTKWQTCKEEGITFLYHYHSKRDGSELLTIRLSEDDYR